MNKDNFLKMMELYAEAAHRGSSNRPQKKWQVIAVSKLQKPDKISQLFDWGQTHFGENYVQELIDKIDFLKNESMKWHFIGHLQKNKVKFLVRKVACIHSVDSLDLAQVIAKKCQDHKTTQKILLQVNLAEEASKSGFQPQNFTEHLESVLALPHLQVLGLMTMPPIYEDLEQVRPLFIELRNLLTNLRAKYASQQHPLNELSMGTTQDALIALEEGSTMIRIGTALFGERSKV